MLKAIVLVVVVALGIDAAPQQQPGIDLGCTLSCGVWNVCRAEDIAKGKGDLTNCGEEPKGCDCTHIGAYEQVVAQQKPGIDVGCTLSCGIWNVCRAEDVLKGKDLTNCGEEPKGCDCTHIGGYNLVAQQRPGIDVGCTLSCGIWNVCRAEDVLKGKDLTNCGEEPKGCDCTHIGV